MCEWFARACIYLGSACAFFSFLGRHTQASRQTITAVNKPYVRRVPMSSFTVSYDTRSMYD